MCFLELPPETCHCSGEFHETLVGCPYTYELLQPVVSQYEMHEQELTSDSLAHFHVVSRRDPWRPSESCAE